MSRTVEHGVVAGGHPAVVDAGVEILARGGNAVDAGIAAMLTTDGPERNTLQWAPDGINFEIMAYIKGAPEANGLFRCENHDDNSLEGLRWGLCHEVDGQSGYMKRFEVDETLKMYFRHRESYE